MKSCRGLYDSMYIFLLNEYKQRGLIPNVWCYVHHNYFSTCDVYLFSLCLICLCIFYAWICFSWLSVETFDVSVSFTCFSSDIIGARGA
jgi:hypothetical protein